MWALTQRGKGICGEVEEEEEEGEEEGLQAHVRSKTRIQRTGRLSSNGST